ncbi:MAG: N(4)-(beta-N-acetylglucosaminyl)-L-asparaginase [Flavobacteriales bacterium]
MSKHPDRRNFIKLGLAGTAAAMAGCVSGNGKEAVQENERKEPVPLVPGKGPIILSTWDHGMAANAKAYQVLEAGGSVLDAVEQGVMVTESDFTNRSVGLGGMPDRDGIVTLDACIQDHDGRAGSVAFVQRFEHPISIARAVMEKTPHVMLVGEGAERWAEENGFTRKDVPMADDARKAWEKWHLKSDSLARTSAAVPRVNVENVDTSGKDNHDTIGMVAMDANGRFAGSCTTSGLAFKIHGRVGDSPIIGAGLFVDGDVGAACATGTGELMIKIAGSHTVVELMRQGMLPEEACKEAVERILRKNPGMTGQQVGFLALRADAIFGGYSLYNDFNYALRTSTGETMVDAPYAKKWE